MGVECNSVVIVGRLGAEPEPIADGRGVKVSIASHRRWKGDDGEWQEQTSWVPVKAWGYVAKKVLEKWHTGDLVHAEGRLDVSKWESSDGKTHADLEVVALRVSNTAGRDRAEVRDRSDDHAPAPRTGIEQFTSHPIERTSSKEWTPTQRELTSPPPVKGAFDDDEIPF